MKSARSSLSFLSAVFVLVATGTALAGNLTVNITPSAAVSAGAQWQVDGGAWKASGATVKNLSNAAHTVAYKTITGWVAPAPATVTLVNGVTTTVTGTYVPPASLVVTLSPTSGQWQLDGGVWRNSGTTATGLTPGAHSISYSALANQIAPATETTSLVSGQTTSISRSYTPAGQVVVMLSPNTAQWRVDGGVWRPSGTYSGLLPAGTHTIDYSPVATKLTPPTETITIVAAQNLTLSRSYTTESGLVINLTPAVGQWRVDGGAWRNSGDRAGQLTGGSHSVEYTGASGYTAPPNESVFLSTGLDQTLSRSYLLPGSITVLLSPTEGQWRLGTGSWQASGATLSGLRPGSYAIQFSSVPGYFQIPTYGVTLAESENKNLSYSYSRHASITVTTAPGSATWRLNGGAWQSSGSTLGALSSGNCTVEYSAVAGMTTPPRDTFYLASGEQKVLNRIYGGAPSLTVNLAPAVGQWRVDGGAWQLSSSVLFNLTPAAHTLEYTPAAGYIAPPTETVWMRNNQSANLTRNYRDASNAYLHVKTIPAYLSEIGLAQWRVDGGAWNRAGDPAAASAGTHTLEFQPASGLEVPPPSSVTVTTGEVQVVEATYHMTHRLRFFLHQDLVAGLSTADLQARLSQYVAHLQTIWHRQTLRRFTFDPTTDISIVTASPFSHNAFPPLPEYGFEVWAYADWSNGSVFGSYGGNGGLDVSGAGGADGMHWTQIYDPSTLIDGSTELFEYWKQIDHITHEFEHTFGGGLGEYYSFTGFKDLTGIAPVYDVDYFAPADPFFNAHSDFWADPLLRNVWDNYRIGSPTTLTGLLDAVNFSLTSGGVINGCYRNADDSRSARTTLPDLSHVRVTIVDAVTGQPIAGSALRMWHRPTPSGVAGAEEPVVDLGSGAFEFSWMANPTQNPFNNYDNGKLLKASANGYQPATEWEWVYDAQRVKTVEGADVWEITIPLNPAP
ncbi:MAG TPA: hypothetical protein VJU77_13295 [Chthoniobacterales bacterium]|nr:hypothetical protein [Chthoniobacterales bacterium]